MPRQREETKPKVNLLTPRLADGTRLHLQLSDADMAKCHIRQLGTWGVVRDLVTGKRYILRGASCGLVGCNCDAVATDLVDNARSGEA
jgi:hypothetical protein